MCAPAGGLRRGPEDARKRGLDLGWQAVPRVRGGRVEEEGKGGVGKPGRKGSANIVTAGDGDYLWRSRWRSALQAGGRLLRSPTAPRLELSLFPLTAAQTTVTHCF